MRNLLTTLLICFWGLSLGLAQEVYRSVGWSAVRTDAVLPGLVRVIGRYLPSADFSELIRGVLSDGRFSLRVEGAVFDWKPEPGTLVEVWGRLKRTPQGYVLSFHNGRNLSDRTRQPRPTMLGLIGSNLQVRLRLAGGGAQPGSVVQGISEDGVVFTLLRYEGPLGLQCLEGTLQRLGEGYTLQNPTPCGR